VAVLRLRQIVLAAVLVAVLIGALGYVLVDAHGNAKRTLVHNFERRAAFAARTTADIMASASTQNGDVIRRYFGGPRETLAAGFAKYERWAGEPTPRLVVLDARGRVLAARRTAVLPVDPLLRRATDGHPTVSDLRLLPGGRTEIHMARPFRSRTGRRVLIDNADAALLPQFMTGYLKAGPAVPGASGYLLDGHGRVIAAGTAAKTGALPSPRSPARAGLRSGGEHGRWIVAREPVEGTDWHLVFVAPRAALLAPVDGDSRRASLIVFGAFVASLLAAIALFISTTRRSAQLATAREREAAASALAHERLHDALTLLPNRNLFADRVEQALAGMGRSGGGLAVVFVDLDRFKLVNDSLGHGHGDGLLRAVAERLSGALRPDDTLSRFGGDEFVVLARNVEDERAALRIAERILETLAAPFELGPRTVQLSASAGIVLHRHDAEAATPAELLRAADVAMYRAKERGPGSLQLFDEGMHRRAVARLDTELALREAVARDELLVHYQPIVALPDGDLHGLEALVRWERPGVGLVPPGDFIALAEESGLIADIGTWVLRRGLQDLARWRAAGTVGEECFLSVNVSPRQLFGVALTAIVADALADADVPPHVLCLEITESVMMEDPERALEVLGELKALGVTLAIDDFGVGHSSLEQLGRMLPVDGLKLDRTFVMGMDGGRDHAIVTTVASLARALGMWVVAEGVETADQAQRLAADDYGLAQGFLFGRPAPADAIDAGALPSGGPLSPAAAER
jgi:diguanylate cyclase (GGDEF)-like protein